MKKITVLLLLLTAAISTAQQLFVEGGKTASIFEYKNSEGNSLENLQAISNSYIMLGYKKQFLTKKMSLNLGITYTGYGAIGSDNAVGNFMEWNVNYAGLIVNLEYDLLNIKKASVYVKGGLSTMFLVNGTQTLNNNVIDLKNNNDFDSTLVAIQLGAGFLHPISDDLSFYVQYVYGKSFDMASGDPELKIGSSNVGFGLLIDISKKPITK